MKTLSLGNRLQGTGYRRQKETAKPTASHLLPQSARFLLFLAVIVISLNAQSALAQDCGSMVRDDAHLFGADIGTVTRAAEALQNDGAQVYVRTFPTTGDQPTAVLLEHHLESQCPDWRAADGSRKENLVAIIYADRDAAGKHSITVSTGGRIDSLVPPTEVDRIRAQVIISHLKSGHPSKAFADGLNAIRTAYEGSRTATTQPVPVQQSSPPAQTEPTSLAGLWVALLLVLLAVVGWFTYKTRGEKERRRAARLKAQQVYNSVTAQINSIDESKTALRSNYNLLASNLPPDQRQKMETALAQTAKVYDEACADFGTKRTSDLEKPGLTVSEYDTLRETYQSILDKLNSAGGLISETGSHLEDLQAQMESAAKKVQEAQAKLDVLSEGLQQVKQAGFKTETYDALVANGRNLIHQANDAINNNLFFDALAQVGQAQELMDQASMGLKLPDKKAELENGIAAVKARMEKTRSAVLHCKPIVDRLDAEFASRSFESVASNGSQATEHINWCDRGIPMAADFATMEKQDWQKSADIVSEANGHLDRADSLVNSITAIEQSLNTARQSAPADVQNAEQDLRAAGEFISSHKADLHTDSGAKLAQAGETISQARSELGKSRPDYFEAVNLAKKAHAAADEVLTTARTEYEAQERQRQKAASALRDAISRVSKAREYIYDHGQYVTVFARSTADAAEQYLANAQKCSDSGDLEGVVKWAALADEAGKNAYSQARNDAEPQRSYDAYTRVNRYYAPSGTTIAVNALAGLVGAVIGASLSSSSRSSSSGSGSWFGGGSSDSSSSSGWFGGGSDSSSSFGGGSDSSSSFSSGGGSDSGSSW